MSTDVVSWDEGIARSLTTALQAQLSPFSTLLVARLSDRRPSWSDRWIRFELVPEHRPTPLLPCFSRAATLPALPAAGALVCVRGRWTFRWDRDPSLGFWVEKLTVLREASAPPAPPRNTAPLSPSLRRVALVTSVRSEGVADVRDALQGAAVETDVVSVDLSDVAEVQQVLQQAATRGCEAVALVRGGGMDGADFAVWNSPALSDVITASPIPVLTALGHSRDETRADQAATRAFPTPTALGDFLRAQAPVTISSPPPAARRRVILVWVYGVAGLVLLLVLDRLIH